MAARETLRHWVRGWGYKGEGGKRGDQGVILQGQGRIYRRTGGGRSGGGRGEETGLLE